VWGSSVVQGVKYRLGTRVSSMPRPQKGKSAADCVQVLGQLGTSVSLMNSVEASSRSREFVFGVEGS